MKSLWMSVAIALTGLFLAGCASVPDEGCDEGLWITMPSRGISDPDELD